MKLHDIENRKWFSLFQFELIFGESVNSADLGIENYITSQVCHVSTAPLLSMKGQCARLLSRLPRHIRVFALITTMDILARMYPHISLYSRFIHFHARWLAKNFPTPLVNRPAISSIEYTMGEGSLWCLWQVFPFFFLLVCKDLWRFHVSVRTAFGVCYMHV